MAAGNRNVYATDSKGRDEHEVDVSSWVSACNLWK